jgi:hypothetical protein
MGPGAEHALGERARLCMSFPLKSAAVLRCFSLFSAVF